VRQRPDRRERPATERDGKPRKATGEFQVSLDFLGDGKYKVLKAWDREGKPLRFNDSISQIDGGPEDNLHGAVTTFLMRVAKASADASHSPEVK
jgi:hypothetical protein